MNKIRIADLARDTCLTFRPAVGGLFLVLLMSSFALSCGGSDISVLLATQGPPLPSYPEDCISADGLDEEFVLANELLTRRSDDLVFDAGERERLATRVREALLQIRELEPDLATLKPVPEFDQRRVTVGLSADSMDVIAEASNGQEHVGPIATGLAELDHLNSELGLRGIWWSRIGDAGGYASICLSDRVNKRAAAERYSDLAEIEYAETDGIMSIGPYPDLAMTEANGTLYAVARQRSGPCFAGCTDFDMHYFRIVPTERGSGGRAERVDEAEAMADEAFQETLELIG